MKYHKFFEKKEIEYRNKILENFPIKKIQYLKKKRKDENKMDSDKIYKEKDDDNCNNNDEDYHPNIIKIVL